MNKHYVIARTPHTCSICNITIEIGQQCHAPSSYRYNCMDCAKKLEDGSLSYNTKTKQFEERSSGAFEVFDEE